MFPMVVNGFAFAPLNTEGSLPRTPPLGVVRLKEEIGPIHSRCRFNCRVTSQSNSAAHSAQNVA